MCDIFLPDYNSHSAADPEQFEFLGWFCSSSAILGGGYRTTSFEHKLFVVDLTMDVCMI